MTAYIKIIIYAALIALVLAWITKFGSDKYEQGYNEAHNDYLKSERAARASHDAAIAKLSESVILESTKRKDAEKRLQEILRTKPRIKIHEVIKEIPCDDMGDKLGGMWKSYREASLSINGNDTD